MRVNCCVWPVLFRGMGISSVAALVFYGNTDFNEYFSLPSEWEDGAIFRSCSALFEAPGQPSQGGVQETAVLHGCCSTSV